MRRLLVFICVVLFVDTVFFAAITPLLPRYTDTLGISKTEAGLLTGAYPAGTLLASLPSGWLAGRWGVKPTLLAGLALLSVSSVAFGLGESYGVLIVARFAQGVGGAALWSGALGWLIESSPRERRGELIGYGVSAALAGVVCGPVLGAAADVLEPEPVFGAVGVAGAALIAVAMRLSAPPVHPASLRILAPALRDPSVLAAMWLVTVPALMFGAIEVLAPLRLDELGAGSTAIAAAFLTAGIIEAVVNPIAGRVSDRRGRRVPILVSLALSVVVALLFVLPETAWVLVVLVALGLPAVGIGGTPAMAQLSDTAEEYRIPQGLGFAFTNLGWSIGQAVGTAGSGRLADAAGDSVPYLALAAACAITFVALARRGPSTDAATLAPDAPRETFQHGSEHSRT